MCGGMRKKKYRLSDPLFGHISWKTTKGILLMGGHNGLTLSNKTYFLVPSTGVGKTIIGPFELRHRGLRKCILKEKTI